MKRLRFFAILLVSLFMLTSCESQEVVTVSDGYTTTTYIYYDPYNNYEVYYIGGIPYYRYWYENRWNYYLVPRERHPYIRRWYPNMRPPRPYLHNHHNGYNHRPPQGRPNTNRNNGGVYHRPNGGNQSVQPNHRPQNGGGFNRGISPNVTRPSTRGTMPSTRGGVSMPRGGGASRGGRR